MIILTVFIHGCPTAPNDYWPCQCNINKTKVGETNHLDCSNRNLTNSRAGEILRVFLADQEMIQQLKEINFSYNQLSKVPFEIRFFHQTWLIDLSHNKIHSVPSGAFNSSATKRQPVKIALDSNKITSIEAKAFQGKKPKQALKRKTVINFFQALSVWVRAFVWWTTVWLVLRQVSSSLSLIKSSWTTTWPLLTLDLSIFLWVIQCSKRVLPKKYFKILITIYWQMILTAWATHVTSPGSSETIVIYWKQFGVQNVLCSLKTNRLKSLISPSSIKLFVLQNYK